MLLCRGDDWHSRCVTINAGAECYGEAITGAYQFAFLHSVRAMQGSPNDLARGDISLGFDRATSAQIRHAAQ